MKFSPTCRGAAFSALAAALSARSAGATAAVTATTCPAPFDPSSEACTTVTSWSELTSALTGGGRVVLCPFSLTRASTIRLYNAVDVICAKSNPATDECALEGGSGYHLDVRVSSTSGAGGARFSGLTFRSASSAAVVIRYGSGHALCESMFEENSRPAGSGAGILQYAGTAVVVKGSSFVENVSNNGGAIYSKGDLRVVASTFVGNTATYGGAIKVSSGTLDLSASTFTSNGSTRTGPAIAYYSSSEFVDGGDNTGSGNLAAINGAECNGVYSSNGCDDFYAPPAYLTPNVVAYDPHGSLLAYKSCGTAECGSDWASDWGNYAMLLDGAMDVDPNDDRATMRGYGSIETVEGSDVAVFKSSPRFYIGQEAGESGWENVEFTAYGMYVSDPLTRPYSGLTLAARSNHASYKLSGCHAPTYYAKIYRDTGNAAFIKEYYHDDTNESVYANSIQVGLFEGGGGGLPFGDWIGMKFVVLTEPNTPNVRLELYVDLTDGLNGGAWELVHSYTDTPGTWLPTEAVPAQCEDLTEAGETILGPRGHCFLRVSGYDEETEVHWKRGSIRNVVAELL